MFSSPAEDRFVSRPGGTQSPRRGGLILLVLALIAGFAAWAWHFELEEVTRAQGRIVPSSSLQIVQTLEGGIVRSIAVAEGDRVEAGQTLMQIDDTGFAAQLGELTQQEAALLGDAARLRAEASGTPLVFPPQLAAFDLVQQSARALYERRQNQLAQEIAVLEGRVIQREAELAEQRALESKLESTLVPLSEELRLSEQMLTRGIMPELEVLRLRARLAEEQGTLNVTRAANARRAASLQEARQQVQLARQAFRVDAQTLLADVQARLAVVQQTLTSARDRVSRTALKAPVAGTIKSLGARTIGSVLAPGAAIAEIVPRDDSLLVEADVAPRDVAFISPNATASVKITAYDYATYGALPATVERISADAFTSPDGQPFFRVTLRTDQAFLGPKSAPLPIIPGMVAQVDIQTGRKSVLDYLAKPILRARAEALTER